MSSSDFNSNNNTTEPTLCSNGCGFFGTAATKGLCSKCYDDFIKSVTRPPLIDGALTIKPTRNSFPAVDLNQDFLWGASSSLLPALDTKNNVAMNEDEEKPMMKKKKKNRCDKCNKKIGLTGFQCRCGNMFCGSHRYAEAHECDFDFKAKGRSDIAKANPLIKPDKLEKF